MRLYPPPVYLPRTFWTFQKKSLSIAEKNGINTVVLNNRNTVAGEEKKDDRAMKLLHRYWNECKGKIQWIAQCNPKENDLYTNIQKAIEPKEGFQYAFENGTDFVCVGMFDFQMRHDSQLVKDIVAANQKRSRPWRG